MTARNLLIEPYSSVVYLEKTSTSLLLHEKRDNDIAMIMKNHFKNSSFLCFLFLGQKESGLEKGRKCESDKFGLK